MKIAFWSPIHGQAGTTSNMIATSLLSGIQYRKKCLITQTHFNHNNLEAPLVGYNSKHSASSEFFQDVGLDMLIRCFKSTRMDEELLDNCCISLSNTNLELLPGTSKWNKDSFDYEMNLVMLNLLRTMEKYTEIIYLDLCSGNNPLSLKIIADSDLTVVNLDQNMAMIDNYFSSNFSVIPGNVFYLFGNYDPNSKYNINNIRRRYFKRMSSKNSGVIPYNTSFRDAQSDGSVIEFFFDNLKCTKNDVNLYFMNQVKKSTEKIVNLAGVASRLNERIS